MAFFNFDQAENFASSNSSVNFFKLQDDGWSAKVRFMYGANESIQFCSVHNVSRDPKRPKYVNCLRNPGDSLEVCPLCNSGQPAILQYYIFLYVMSITRANNGTRGAEEPVNQVMLFQRGKTFDPSIKKVIYKSEGTPLVSNIFEITRFGRANDKATKYEIDFVSRDNTTLESLPERPSILGSPLLPNLTAQEMMQYCNPSNIMPQGVTPRTMYAQGAPMNNQMQQAPMGFANGSTGVPF